MALVATKKLIAGSATTHSIGPVCVQYFDLSAISGDTSGTITSDLRGISHVEVMGLVQSAVPSVSGSVITLAFADPLATVKGHCRVYGAK
jgi:hypothetical protein